MLERDKIPKRRMSWVEFHRLTGQIYAQIFSDMVSETDRREYQQIYGIPRGGLMVATILSHLLELPMVTTYYRASAWNTLVVDDLLESGETLKRFRDLGSECAVVIAKTQDDKILPRYVGELSRLTSEWIVFPWETDKSTFTTNGGSDYHGLHNYS